MCINNYIHTGWRQLPSWWNCSWLSPDLWQWIHVAWGRPSHHHHCQHCFHQHTSRYLNNCVATALSFFKTLFSCFDSYFGKITQSSVPLCLCWEYLKLRCGAWSSMAWLGFSSTATAFLRCNWHGRDHEYDNVSRPASAETETSHSGDDITSG